jgi:protein SCO1/2
MRLNLENWNLVTGDKIEIYTIAESYLLSANSDSSAPGGFLHSQSFVIVDKEGRVRSGYSNFICQFCGESSTKAKIACPACRKEKALIGNPVGKYDGTQDYVLKELIKDVKTLLAEYHEDAKVVRDVK